jgi:hypothetical protein
VGEVFVPTSANAVKVNGSGVRRSCPGAVVKCASPLLAQPGEGGLQIELAADRAGRDGVLAEQVLDVRLVPVAVVARRGADLDVGPQVPRQAAGLAHQLRGHRHGVAELPVRAGHERQVPAGHDDACRAGLASGGRERRVGERELGDRDSACTRGGRLQHRPPGDRLPRKRPRVPFGVFVHCGGTIVRTFDHVRHGGRDSGVSGRRFDVHLVKEKLFTSDAKR